MESAWLLRSPHQDGVYLAVRTLPGARETLAHLLQWSAPGRKYESSSSQVIDAALLPSDISAMAWNARTGGTSPLQLAACSAGEIHIIDLGLRSQPRRTSASFVPNNTGALGAGICWVGAGQLVAFADGHCVSALDAATGKGAWSVPVPQNSNLAAVTSLTAVSENEILVGWRKDASGGIQLLDLRIRDRTTVADSTLGVQSLCCSPLQSHLAASHAGNDDSQGEMFVWDLRCINAKAQPVSRLRGGNSQDFFLSDNISSNRQNATGVRPPLLLSESVKPSSLEWSPSKAGTLLGVASTVYVCRLWDMQPSGDDSEDAAVLEPPQAVVPSTWVGTASALRFSSVSSTASESSTPGAVDDLVAAGWAHPSDPGVVLALRSDGTLAVATQRGPHLCAWSPRGGGAIVRQWTKTPPLPASTGTLVAPETKASSARLTTGSATGGSPVDVRADKRLMASDACCLMRTRAEDYNYGVSKMNYDEYSRIIRSTGASKPTTDALYSAWQWAKVADSSVASTSNIDGDIDQEADAAFKGAQELLHLDEPAEDEEVEQTLPGVITYASDGRRRALQVLGFPKNDAPFSASPDAASPTVDDLVRRVLRAVVWLQWDRAASDFEVLEPYCGPHGRMLVQQFVLTLHAASACLQLRMRNAKTSEEERGDDTARALCTAIQGIQKELAGLWQDVPAPATLHLALCFIDAVVKSSGFDDKTGAQSPFEEQVHALLVRASFDLSYSDNWMNVYNAKLQQMGIEQHRVVITDQAGAPVRLASIGTGESALTPSRFPLHVEVARPSCSFRCALALRFLSRNKLETMLKAIGEGECFGSGLLDGLCVLGLRGGEDSTPLTVGALEELLQAAPPSLAFTASAIELHGAGGRRRGDLSGAGKLVGLQGTGTDGVSLVSAYVERTGDVQTAALLLCHTAHLAQPPIGLIRFLVQYLALLARWQLYHQRAGLHTLLTMRLPHPEALRSRGPVVFCYYCNSQLTGPLVGPPTGSGDIDAVLRRCPKPACGKPTPSCAVCLLPIFVVSSRSKPSATLAVDDWVAWCQGCHHGGHISHLEEWFSKHVECPVAGCDCLCGLY